MSKKRRQSLSLSSIFPTFHNNLSPAVLDRYISVEWNHPAGGNNTAAVVEAIVILKNDNKRRHQVCWFCHCDCGTLQQWWDAVHCHAEYQTQFLHALAVQYGLVLRDSAQISIYCMPRCLVGEAWPEQPVTGDTDRPRKRRSMEGSRGFRRLTGQKAEPPWGVKLTLLGSGQDGWRRVSSWQADLQVKK